jgi:hypothetical protein
LRTRCTDLIFPETSFLIHRLREASLRDA